MNIFNNFMRFMTGGRAQQTGQAQQARRVEADVVQPEIVGAEGFDELTRDELAIYEEHYNSVTGGTNMPKEYRSMPIGQLTSDPVQRELSRIADEQAMRKVREYREGMRSANPEGEPPRGLPPG